MSARSSLIADTGVLYSALVRTDRAHRECVALLAGGPTVMIPAPVIGELDWLGRSRRRPHLGPLLLDSVVDGSVLVADLDAEDWQRVRELVDDYADLPLGVVDASVIAVAERLEEPVIATLDRRHFSVVRPRHVHAFELLP